MKKARSDNGSDSCPEYMTCPGIELVNAQKALSAAKDDLKTKTAVARHALGGAAESNAALSTQCTDVVKKADDNATPLTGGPLQEAVACGDYLDAVKTVHSDQANVDWSTKWKAERANVTDGQLLFELNCARCHTEGWSSFDPTIPPGTPNTVNSVDILGLSGGGGGNGGGIGFNLRDGDLNRRFGTDARRWIPSPGRLRQQRVGAVQAVRQPRPRFRKDARLRAGQDHCLADARCHADADAAETDHLLRALLPRIDDVHRRDAGVRHDRRWRRRTTDAANHHHHGSEGVTMAVLHLLLAEGGKTSLWNPTIIGVLTVLCAVGLFCGSTYLLLGTNLGARLGFLVAAAGLSGFLVLLTTLWLTTPGNATGNSDLDPPHGNSASWKMVELVDTPAAVEDRGGARAADQGPGGRPDADHAGEAGDRRRDRGRGTDRGSAGAEPAVQHARDRVVDRLPADLPGREVVPVHRQDQELLLAPTPLRGARESVSPVSTR